MTGQESEECEVCEDDLVEGNEFREVELINIKSSLGSNAAANSSGSILSDW